MFSMERLEPAERIYVRNRNFVPDTHYYYRTYRTNVTYDKQRLLTYRNEGVLFVGYDVLNVFLLRIFGSSPRGGGFCI